MKIRLLTACLVLFFGSALMAQEQEVVILKNREDSLRVGWWERNTQLAANFSQASFNDSWQGGGVNNFALGFLFNNKAVKHKNKWVWTNDVQFQYGFLRNKGLDMRKSVDRLFAETKYASAITPKLNWFAGVNLLTQFSSGYMFGADGKRGDMISNFLSPGFLSEGVGVEWKAKPYFIVQLGGATMRQTFVSSQEVFDNTADEKNDYKSYGVARGKTLLNEMGLQGVAAFDKNFTKSFNLKWRYQAFFAYAPDAKPIDHNINLIATSKIGK
jgi:hypothetical protein